jgi:hypothetical protein
VHNALSVADLVDNLKHLEKWSTCILKSCVDTSENGPLKKFTKRWQPISPNVGSKEALAKLSGDSSAAA